MLNTKCVCSVYASIKRQLVYCLQVYGGASNANFELSHLIDLYSCNPKKVINHKSTQSLDFYDKSCN